MSIKHGSNRFYPPNPGRSESWLCRGKVTKTAERPVAAC
jgi:hypothetical protein